MKIIKNEKISTVAQQDGKEGASECRSPKRARDRVNALGPDQLLPTVPGVW